MKKVLVIYYKYNKNEKDFLYILSKKGVFIMVFIYQPAEMALTVRIPNNLDRIPSAKMRLTNTETKETSEWTPVGDNDPEYYNFYFLIGQVNGMSPGEYQYEVGGNRGMLWIGSRETGKTYTGPDRDTVKYYTD